MVVDDVRHKLRMSERLIQAAHDAEANVLVVPLHECGNDGMKRTLVAGKCIGRRGSSEKRPPRSCKANPMPSTVTFDPKLL